MNERWSTPGRVFDPLNAEFCFTLDVCAEPWNAKCERLNQNHARKFHSYFIVLEKKARYIPTF